MKVQLDTDVPIDGTEALAEKATAPCSRGTGCAVRRHMP